MRFKTAARIEDHIANETIDPESDPPTCTRSKRAIGATEAGGEADGRDREAAGRRTKSEPQHGAMQYRRNLRSHHESGNLGGGTQPPHARSSSSATRMVVTSLRPMAATCTPTGRP